MKDRFNQREEQAIKKQFRLLLLKHYPSQSYTHRVNEADEMFDKLLLDLESNL